MSRPPEAAGEGSSPFPPEVFRRRRERVRKELDGGALLLPGADVLHRSRDTQFPFRPDSELFYLTGCAEPRVVALFRDAQEEEGLTLFVPRRDPETELWSGPRLGPEEARERFAAEASYPLDELEERLPDLLKPASRIFFRLGAHPRVEPLVIRALAHARGRGARKGEGPRSVWDPGMILDELRLRKEPEEVDRIRRAAGITVEAFREAMGAAGPGEGEWAVEAALEAGFRRRGARGPAFPTIVGSGPNACVLHYEDNARRMEEGELVLLDGGAEVGLYAGDVTRTFPVAGGFDTAQRAVYEVVREAHEAALAAVHPGATTAQVHRAAVQALTRGLVDLEVLSGDVDALVEEEAYKPFFPHQTSHWLGLDVHDVGDYAVAGTARLLEPGMVLTVEPGLYFRPSSVEGSPDSSASPAASPDSPGPFRGIGVRLEDDVLVTESGAENLTAPLPVDAEEMVELVGVAAGEGGLRTEAW